MALKGLDAYPTEALTGMLGAEFIGVAEGIADRSLSLRRYEEAKAAYERCLELIETARDFPVELAGKAKAGILHRLGLVAQEQRRWADASELYQTALTVYTNLTTVIIRLLRLAN